MSTIQAITFGAMLTLSPSLILLAVLLAKDWIETRHYAAEHEADNHFR